MYANNNYNDYTTQDTLVNSHECIYETVDLLEELSRLMYNPTYDLQATIGILHNENEATIIYKDGTQFQMEKR